MGRLRKAGWLFTGGRVDWRDADRRAAHNTKLMLKEQKREAAGRRYVEAIAERDPRPQTPGSVHSVSSENRSNGSSGGHTSAEQLAAWRIQLLRELVSLRERGVLTSDEYEKQKAELLNGHSSPENVQPDSMSSHLSASDNEVWIPVEHVMAGDSVILDDRMRRVVSIYRDDKDSGLFRIERADGLGVIARMNQDELRVK